MTTPGRLFCAGRERSASANRGQRQIFVLKYLLKIDLLCFDGQPDRAVRIKGGQ
jgi:hypothetical protein